MYEIDIQPRGKKNGMETLVEHNVSLDMSEAVWVCFPG